MFWHSQMSVLALTSECGYMLKFTSELTLRCEDWHIQKGRNHHVTTLIDLNSSQMSIIFMIVNEWIIIFESIKLWIFFLKFWKIIDTFLLRLNWIWTGDIFLDPKMLMYKCQKSNFKKNWKNVFEQNCTFSNV